MPLIDPDAKVLRVTVEERVPCVHIPLKLAQPGWDDAFHKLAEEQSYPAIPTTEDGAAYLLVGIGRLDARSVREDLDSVGVWLDTLGARPGLYDQRLAKRERSLQYLERHKPFDLERLNRIVVKWWDDFRRMNP